MSGLLTPSGPEASQPSGLRLSLLPFQRQALHRMLQAERHPLGAFGPLILRSDLAGEPLFFSPLWPGARRTVSDFMGHGGLLCEEMGLGKTIICISLILSNPLAEAARCAEEERAERKAIIHNEAHHVAVRDLSVYGGDRAVRHHKAFCKVERTAGAAANSAVGKKGAAAAKRAATAATSATASVSSTDGIESLGYGLPSAAALALLPLCFSGRGGQLLLCKGTLVVCPLTLVSQWQSELATHAPGLRVCVYHGSARPHQPAVLAEYDVVLTSYATLVRDVALDQTDVVLRPGDAFKSPLNHMGWHRLILDESHMLRARTTKQTRAVMSLTARFRWSVSATPGRTYDDLSQHLRFLTLPAISRMDHASVLDSLTYVVTRHTAQQMLDGQPVLQLPSRRMVTVRVTLSADETRRYTALHERATEMFSRLHQAGGVRQYHIRIMSFLQALRLAGSGGAAPVLPNIDVDALVEHLSSRKLNKHIPANGPHAATVGELSTTTDAVDAGAQCPVCLDVPDTPVVTACRHIYCFPCIMALATSTYDGNRAPCPLCRRVVRLKDLKRLVAGEAAGPALEAGAGDDDDDSEDDLDDEGGAQHGRGRGRGRSRAARARGRGVRGSGQHAAAASAADVVAAAASGAATAAAATAAAATTTSTARVPPLSTLPFTSKPRAVVQLVKDIVRKEPEGKILIFSHFQATLDLLAQELPAHGFESRTLHGGMTRTARSRALKQFAETSSRCVFLISIRAGSVGVNLTAANHVVFVEPTINPSLRAQAVGRVHRLGQARAITVHTLVATGTVEEALHRIACEKSGERDGQVASAPAVGGAINATAQASGLFTASEMMTIFRV